MVDVDEKLLLDPGLDTMPISTVNLNIQRH